MKVRVMTDSGSGLNEKEAQELNIDLLPLQVTIEDDHYQDGVNLDIDTLYDALAEGKVPSTSLPSLAYIEDKMEEYQKEGVDALVLITLSSGLSSTNSAVSASAKAHDINVYTTDICTTLGVQRYLAKAAAALVEKGAEPQEIIEKIEKAVDGSRGYLIAEDLNHLARGGRLSPAAAKLGGLLKIKPILEVSKNSEGKVDVLEKVRTMSKAVKKAVDTALEEMDPNQEYQVYVVDSRNEDHAKVAADMLSEAAGSHISVNRQPICAVIASHTGLGAVGVQYVPVIDGVKE